jgi:hypothetical protein
MAGLPVILVENNILCRVTREIPSHNIVTLIVFALCKHTVAQVVRTVTSHSYVLRKKKVMLISFEQKCSKKRVLKSPHFLAERSSRKTAFPLFGNCFLFSRFDA